MLRVLAALALVQPSHPAATVTASLESAAPLLSAGNPHGKGRCTAGSFCFNAAYVPGHATQPAGILARLRNHTGGENVGPSQLGFAAVHPSHGGVVCDDMTTSDIVFQPEIQLERNGTEDPRIALDASTGTYHLTYVLQGMCTSMPSNPSIYP